MIRQRRITGELDHDRFAAQSTLLFGAAIRNITHHQVRTIYRAIVDEDPDLVHTFAPELIRQLRRNGLTPMLISASPDFLVSIRAKDLGVTKAAGTCYPPMGEFFSATPTGCPGAGDSKARIAQALLAPAPIDWNCSLALGAAWATCPFCLESGSLSSTNPRKNWLYSREQRAGNSAIAILS